jgi:hypothetical protein
MKPTAPISQSLHATRLPCAPRKSTTSLARSFAAIDRPGVGFLCLNPLQHSVIVLEEFCQTAHEITLLTTLKFSTIIYGFCSPNPMARARAKNGENFGVSNQRNPHAYHHQFYYGTPSALLFDPSRYMG